MRLAVSFRNEVVDKPTTALVFVITSFSRRWRRSRPFVRSNGRGRRTGRRRRLEWQYGAYAREIGTPPRINRRLILWHWDERKPRPKSGRLRNWIWYGTGPWRGSWGGNRHRLLHPGRIEQVHGIVVSVWVEVDSTAKGDGVFTQEPSRALIVVSGAIVIQASFRVRFPRGVAEWIHQRARRVRQPAK